MRIVIPKIITSADITSTNLVEDTSAYPGLSEFAAGATYAKDALVFVNTTMMIYKSTADANTGHYPPDYSSGTGTLWWAEIAPLNRLAMYDTKTSTQSVSPGTDPGVITQTINAAECDAIFFANLSATSVGIVLKDGSGNVKESSSIDLVYRYVTRTFYDYLTNRFYVKTNCLLTFGRRWDSTIDLTITNANAGEHAKCGRCTLGQRWSLGGTKYGCSLSYKDYSGVTTDTYGNVDIVTRDKVNYVECEINSVDDDMRLDELYSVLRQVQSVPTVWDFNNIDARGVSTGYDCMSMYGFSSNTNITPESLRLRTAQFKVTALV